MAKFNDLKNILGRHFWQSKLSYFQKILHRLFDRKYLSNCICLFENKEQLDILQLKNGEIVKQRSFPIADLEWKKYLKKHHDLPVYIITQRLENTFKTLPAEKLNFWERILMIRKIRTHDSSYADLIDCYQFVKAQKKSYSLVSAQSSDALQNIYREFATLPNVLAGVRSLELEMHKKMLATAALDYNLHNLTICVIEQSAKEFTLIVADSYQLILQRHVCCSEKDIETEVKATSKFLTRFGYDDGHLISVLVPENIFKNIKCLQSNIEFFPISHKVFSKENYKPEKALINFVPKCLQQSYYGYLVPIIVVRYFVPAFFVFAIIAMALQVKLFFQNSDHQVLLAKYEDVALQIPADINQQVYLYKQFQAYIAAINANPSWRISKINKNLLRAKVPVNSVSWKLAQDQLSQFEILLNFSSVSPKKLQSLRKSFDKECEKNLGLVETNWVDADKEITLTIKGKSTNENQS